ncbi:hypothetical protein KM043_014738 [Ampulex compressa]|nr:hypothetical protein KM043_014738 [Ampulex compressa]
MLRTLKYIRCQKALTRNVVISKQTDILHLAANRCMLYCSRRYTETEFMSVSLNYKAISEKVDLLNKLTENKRWITPTHINYITNFIRSANHIDSMQALSVLRCCENGLIDYPESEIIKVIQKFWDILIHYKIPMSINHYNTLFKIYLKYNHKFHPPTFLTEIIGRGMKPNVITYECFISYFAQNGNIPDSLKALEHIKLHSQPITVKIMNSMIEAYMNINNPEEAFKIVDMMKNANMDLTSETYTTLMCIYAKNNSLKEILDIISQCAKQDILLNNESLLEVIYILASNNHLEAVKDIMPFLDKCTSPNDEMFLIIKFVDIGHIKLALDLLCKIFSNVDYSEEYIKRIFVPKLATSNLTFEELVDASEILKKNFHFENPFLLMLHYTLIKENEELSLKILKYLKNLQHPLRTHYFWPILATKARVHDVNGILNTLDKMINEFDMMPCIYSISYLCPKGIQDLQIVCSQLQKYKISPTIYNNFVVCKLLEYKEMVLTAEYIKKHPDYYWYDLLHSLLAKCFAVNKNVPNYLYITNNLYREVTSEHVSERYKDNDKLIVQIALNESLFDLMQVLKHDKELFKQVINALPIANKSLTKEVIEDICVYLDKYMTSNLLRKLKNMLFSANSNDIQMILNFATNSTIKHREDVPLLEAELISTIKNCLLENQHVSNTIHKKLKQKYSKQANVVPPCNEILTKLISYFSKKEDYKSCKICFNALHKDYPDKIAEEGQYLEYINSLEYNKEYSGNFEFVNSKTPMETVLENGELSDNFVESIKKLQNIESKDANVSDVQKQLCNTLYDNVQYYIKKDQLVAALKLFFNIPYTEGTANTMTVRLLVTEISKRREYPLLQKLINHCSERQGTSATCVNILMTCLKWKHTDSFLFLARHWSMPISTAFKYQLLNDICKLVQSRKTYLQIMLQLPPSPLFNTNDKSIMCERIASTYQSYEKEKAQILHENMYVNSIPLSDQMEARLIAIMQGVENLESKAQKLDRTEKYEKKKNEEVLSVSIDSELATNVR